MKKASIFVLAVALLLTLLATGEWSGHAVATEMVRTVPKNIPILPVEFVPEDIRNEELPPSTEQLPIPEPSPNTTEHTPQSRRAEDFVPPIIYGVNFMSSAEEPADAQRYANAKSTGATFNRWPFYWHTIEISQNQFDYSNHDPVVIDDMRNGLLHNAILMGIPGFYFTDGKAVPGSLNQSVFSDGTDVPGPGKSINPNNHWARYVFNTVNRYKPGGTIAQAQGWSGNTGIRHWELWNEPDLPWFWDGTKAEYARLLKVGYLAVKHADSSAQVIFGAVANNFDDLNYYKDVLTILNDDTSQPLARDYNYFHDIMATHSYYYPWQSWYHVFRARNAMLDFGFESPIWLNETGMPAWDDYPGPIWDPGSFYRGTQTEQADFMIMSAFYAMFAGADAYFHFQLYDACGNQPQHTDFPPHTGNLCTSDGMLVTDPSKPCSGDANGLFRNANDAICFRQHPQAETARQNFTAYQLLTEYLQDVEPLARFKFCTHNAAHDGQEWIAFYRPNTNQRVMAVWSCWPFEQTAKIPAIDTGALLVHTDGTTEFIGPHTDGHYYLTLPPATNQNYVGPNPDFWPVGGRPYILVERDLQKPTVTLDATPNDSGIWVNWSGSDGQGSGLAGYDVTVQVDGGAAQPWLTGTFETGATWSGSYTHGVRFTAVARDKGSNVSDEATQLIGSEAPVNRPFPSVTKSVNRENALIGTTLRYEITVNNWGDVNSATLMLTDTLPAEVDYIEGTLSASSGGAWHSNGKIYWTSSVGPGTTVTIRYDVRVRWIDTVNGWITNQVLMTDPTNNRAERSAGTFVANQSLLSEQTFIPLVTR